MVTWYQRHPQGKYCIDPLSVPGRKYEVWGPLTYPPRRNERNVVWIGKLSHKVLCFFLPIAEIPGWHIFPDQKRILQRHNYYIYNYCKYDNYFLNKIVVQSNLPFRADSLQARSEKNNFFVTADIKISVKSCFMPKNRLSFQNIWVKRGTIIAQGKNKII